MFKGLGTLVNRASLVKFMENKMETCKYDVLGQCKNEFCRRELSHICVIRRPAAPCRGDSADKAQLGFQGPFSSHQTPKQSRYKRECVPVALNW